MILVPCYRIQLFMNARRIYIYDKLPGISSQKKRNRTAVAVDVCSNFNCPTDYPTKKKKGMSYVHPSHAFHTLILALMTHYTHAHRTIFLTVRAGLRERPSLPTLHRLFHTRPASPSSSSRPTKHSAGHHTGGRRCHGPVSAVLLSLLYKHSSSRV